MSLPASKGFEIGSGFSGQSYRNFITPNYYVFAKSEYDLFNHLNGDIIFLGTFLTGSEHNDEFFRDEHGRIRTRTNRSGGIQVVDQGFNI